MPSEMDLHGFMPLGAMCNFEVVHDANDESVSSHTFFLWMILPVSKALCLPLLMPKLSHEQWEFHHVSFYLQWPLMISTDTSCSTMAKSESERSSKAMASAYLTYPLALWAQCYPFLQRSS